MQTALYLFLPKSGLIKNRSVHVRNGMTAVISIKHPDPRFEGQTKTKLDNQDASKAVAKVTGEEVGRKDRLKGTVSCCFGASSCRISLYDKNFALRSVFRFAICKFSVYARELNILKEKDVNFTGADVRNGMTAVISIKHPDPRFEFWRFLLQNLPLR